MGHPVIHFEIGCRNSAQTEAFYAKLFDWQIEHALIDTSGEGGITGHINSLGHEPHHYVTVYVQVDDLQSIIARAEALGGKSLLGPIQLPDGRYFAWLADLDGNIIGIIEPLKK